MNDLTLSVAQRVLQAQNNKPGGSASLRVSRSSGSILLVVGRHQV